MPNKTIYVKDSDVPLLERAQEQLGESVSAMFAEFLRERIARLAPEESRILAFISQITSTRKRLAEQRDLPAFIDGEYAEAQANAETAIQSLRAGEVRITKGFFWAANQYYEKAVRDTREATDLVAKLAKLVGS